VVQQDGVIPEESIRPEAGSVVGEALVLAMISCPFWSWTLRIAMAVDLCQRLLYVKESIAPHQAILHSRIRSRCDRPGTDAPSR
jgi:hypothetical protein